MKKCIVNASGEFKTLVDYFEENSQQLQQGALGTIWRILDVDIRPVPVSSDHIDSNKSYQYIDVAS